MWLFLLICISTVGFTLYNKLLTCNPIGKVAIYNSLIPVVGAVSSCLCLHEAFYWKYVLAGALATAGIYIINKGNSTRQDGGAISRKNISGKESRASGT